MKKNLLIGKVVSNKMNKTVVVEIERKVAHPVYKKILRKIKRIKADSSGQTLLNGDIVKIEPTKPISRTKHFKVVSKA